MQTILCRTDNDLAGGVLAWASVKFDQAFDRAWPLVDRETTNGEVPGDTPLGTVIFPNPPLVHLLIKEHGKCLSVADLLPSWALFTEV